MAFDNVYTNVYTKDDKEVANMEIAKLFSNGGSQAVRLPKNCRFNEDEVEVFLRPAIKSQVKV